LIRRWRQPSGGEGLAHSQFAVARFLLAEAEKRGIEVNMTKLLKLVFLAHAWALALHGAPLVRGQLQAWQYGPVFRQLYHELKERKYKPLTVADIPETDESFESDEERLLIWVLERYGSLSATQLTALTHAPGSPWESTWRNAPDGEIPTELIQFYYRKLLAKMRSPAQEAPA